MVIRLIQKENRSREPEILPQVEGFIHLLPLSCLFEVLYMHLDHSGYLLAVFVGDCFGFNWDLM